MHENIKSILGNRRKVLIAVFGLVAIATGGSALLAMFGQVTTSAALSQAILVDNKSVGSGALDITDNISLYGGESASTTHTIINRANVPISVLFSQANNNSDLNSTIQIDGLLVSGNYTMLSKSSKVFSLNYSAKPASAELVFNVTTSILPQP